MNHNYTLIVFGTIIVSIVFFPIFVYADLESIVIDGPEHPLEHSIFTIKIHVEGVSRASYGDFSVVMTLEEKDTGKVLDSIPDYLLTGVNSRLINMKDYGSGSDYIAGTTYIIKIQHANKIFEFEFTPVATVEEMSSKQKTSGDGKTKIVITGETNPQVSFTSKPYTYIVEVIGEPQNNARLESCDATGKTCEFAAVLDEDNLVHEFTMDWSGFLKSGFSIPEKETFTFKNGDATGSLTVYPQLSIQDGSKTKINSENASIEILKITQANNAGLIEYELCAKIDLSNPEFIVVSDAKKHNEGLNVVLKAGECFSGTVEILAKSPASITIPMASISENKKNVDVNAEKLILENQMLKEQIEKLEVQVEKKDAVIMEQIKVLAELAQRIKITIFEHISSFLYQT